MLSFDQRGLQQYQKKTEEAKREKKRRKNTRSKLEELWIEERGADVSQEQEAADGRVPRHRRGSPFLSHGVLE